ncbi:MAG TPA: alpha/beta fold hydrolase [Streptosporangiaceae bacterium]
MEQRIATARLRDGAAVAYATAGEGPFLVYVPGWLTHLDRSWAMPPERGFYEALARGRTLVRYDRPGCGLSDRDGRPPSMELELETIGAVTKAAGAERFDLLGISFGAPVAARWAAEHPDRVSRLVLYGGWARGPDISPPEVRELVLGLVDAHWGLGSGVLGEIFAPDAGASTRAAFGSYMREAASPGTARALLALSYQVDVTADLARITAPALVIHREQDRAAPLRQGQALADGIPGARFELLPGRSHLPYIGDADALATSIRRFLGLPSSRRRAIPELTPRQREVARLIADGLTNREIGARLHITERSAESHVERIMLRMGFRSRAQIAAWFAASGPP